jgi:hypothetical protein
MENELAQILDQCQKSFASHQRCMKALAKLCKQDYTSFKDALVGQLNKVLLVLKREPSIERLIQFIVNGVVFLGKSEDNRKITNVQKSSQKKGKKKEIIVEDENLPTFLLQYLLDRTNAKDKAVRFRSCQVIAGLLAKMEEIEY